MGRAGWRGLGAEGTRHPGRRRTGGLREPRRGRFPGGLRRAPGGGAPAGTESLGPDTREVPRGSPTPARSRTDRAPRRPPRPLTAAHRGKLRPGVSGPRPPGAAPGETRSPLPRGHPGPQPLETPRTPNLGRTLSGPSGSAPGLAPAQWGGDAAARSLRQKERWRRGSRGSFPGDGHRDRTTRARIARAQASSPSLLPSPGSCAPSPERHPPPGAHDLGAFLGDAKIGRKTYI